MSVTITLGMVCWNTREVSVESFRALLRESRQLTGLGYGSDTIIIDNASTDHSLEALMHTADESHEISLVVGRLDPTGSSVLRNDIIRLAEDSDFLLLTDGDIEIIPGSIVAMAEFLQEHLELSGLAMNPIGSTDDRSLTTAQLDTVTHTSTDALMYVCGYGLFRTSIFRKVSFTESGPFGEVGWGSEDDDFYLQLLQHNFACAYIDGAIYLHRQVRSSWDSLRALHIDPVENFQRRREYLLSIWKGASQQAGRLRLLASQQIGGSHGPRAS